MPHYKWEEINDTMITPSHSTAKGKTITGNQIILQKIEYRGDRGDGQNGARPHNHPEEQFLIVTEGTFKLREDDGEWSTLKAGDTYHIPAYQMHEMIVEGEGEIYQFKIRVPGHSVYDHSWAPGSKEAWEKHFTEFNEMTKKFKEKNPW